MKIDSVRTRIAMCFLAALASNGCAKNVDKIEFTKWGNSYVPQRNQTSIDTTAQGGVNPALPPSSTNHVVPKASAGGAYQRSFATSTNYRLVGGFHTSK